MSTQRADPQRYTIGGTIGTDDKIYIPRQTDQELFDHCVAGDFCYVLTACQLGKSSLMTRLAERLEREAVGICPVRIDLTRIGGRLKSPDQFYVGMMLGIIRQLGLAIKPAVWWEGEERRLLSPVQHFD